MVVATIAVGVHPRGQEHVVPQTEELLEFARVALAPPQGVEQKGAGHEYVEGLQRHASHLASAATVQLDDLYVFPRGALRE